MKSKSKVFMVLSGLLVLMAISGLLDESAYHYLEGISKKNLGFLALIVELKVIMSGIGDLVPFLKGHSGSLNDSIGKVENYLLLTSVVALVELMVLGICKSWVLKLLILLTFIFSIFGAPRSLATKLLILLLVLNPGLQLFSVSMQHLSKYATVDYGETYLTKLQLSVEKLKKEKAQLTQEHQKKITEINNGKKGVRFFSKLKEDISYDVDKSKLTIKGDFTELRSLVHDGGKELIRKISIFCSMVVFSLFLMPMGYALIVYTIFKSVEQELPASMREKLPDTLPGKKPGWKWHFDHWKGVFQRGKEEAAARLKDLQPIESELKTIREEVVASVPNVGDDARKVEGQLAKEAAATKLKDLQPVESELKTIKEEIVSSVPNVEDDVRKIEDQMLAKEKEVEGTVKEIAEDHSEEGNAETREEPSGPKPPPISI